MIWRKSCTLFSFYQSKACPRSRSGNDKKDKEFDALEWLAAMCSHVPNKGEQMVRYYGHYSNVARGKRKMLEEDELIPSVPESNESSKERRKNWARLIQKIYEIDPLTCPKCFSQMRVISVIDDEDVIKKILKHLGLWELKARPPPKATGPQKTPEYSVDYSVSQLPEFDNWPPYQVRGRFMSTNIILKNLQPDLKKSRGFKE